ncbi:hypothetical protein ACEN9H_24390 [Massilia cellulosiltytica]|uniref:hypothetical protein n=1 Tax=Massilia cellulosiltytica TaxID=2683234 RepID=UPI0039B655CC
MRTPYLSFLLVTRWASVIVALMYHVRFLLFVDYEHVHAKTWLTNVFYFLTGLGHESFAVFLVLDGILTGRALRAGTIPGRRAVALYGLLLPGLILGAAADVAGVRFFNGSALYTAYPAFSTLTLGYASLLGNMFMLQPFVVPTFGSNGMLYLLSFLFWSTILLDVFLRATRAGRVVLLTAVVVLAPPLFLIWSAIWLTGVAVAHMGALHSARPSLPVAIVGFLATLLLSRFLGAGVHGPPAFGAWLADCKFLLVGWSFAAIAWALAPPGAQHTTVPDDPAPAFTFFFHFPVMMLLVGIGTTLPGQALMQQPTPARYGAFVAVAAACVGTTVLVARTARPGKAQRQAALPWPGAGHS